VINVLIISKIIVENIKINIKVEVNMNLKKAAKNAVIQTLSENITYYQAKKDNFWIGIVYPDIYDQFQTIDYTEFDKK
jgi:hypothetical protein